MKYVIALFSLCILAIFSGCIQQTQCISGDNYCPSGCNYSNDSDCPTVDQCQSDIDCTDNDDSTIDTCSGTPKICTHTLKTCIQRNGYICSSTENCPQSFIPASDSNRCCPTACNPVDLCVDVNCPNDKKCVNGTCVLKTCAERGGIICAANRACSENTVIASDTTECCIGACIAKTCSEQGGNICSIKDVCSGGWIEASDAYYPNACCSGTCQITENKLEIIDYYTIPESPVWPWQKSSDFDIVVKIRNNDSTRRHRVDLLSCLKNKSFEDCLIGDSNSFSYTDIYIEPLKVYEHHLSNFDKSFIFQIMCAWKSHAIPGQWIYDFAVKSDDTSPRASASRVSYEFEIQGSCQ